MNQYKYSEIPIGLCESFSHEVTEDMENSFRKITGDINPLHYDDDYAKAVRGGNYYSKHVTFGMLTASFYSTLAGVYLPGKYSLIHSVDLGFAKPVYAGDTLTVSGTVIEKTDALNLIILAVIITNQDKKVVSKGKMKIIVME